MIRAFKVCSNGLDRKLIELQKDNNRIIQILPCPDSMNLKSNEDDTRANADIVMNFMITYDDNVTIKPKDVILKQGE